MGYSADRIQSYDINTHTIIECNPIVLERLEKYKEEHENVVIIKGRWQDVLETCEKFDCIFFDDYMVEDRNDFFRFYKFLDDILCNHSKLGTKIVSYAAQEDNLLPKLNCIKYECIDYDIDIPISCKYVSGNKMCIPLIIKINEVHNEIKRILNPVGILTDSSNNWVGVPSKTTDNNCICNTIVIDNFYNNINNTRRYILSRNFVGEYSEETFSNKSVQEHIQGYLPNFNGKINNFDNEINGRCKKHTIISNPSITNNENYKWKGILFMSPDAKIEHGIEIYQYQGDDNWKENINNETYWKLVDTFGNIYNRLILLPGFIFYKAKGNFGDGKTEGNLIQEFYFDTEN